MRPRRTSSHGDYVPVDGDNQIRQSLEWSIPAGESYAENQNRFMVMLGSDWSAKTRRSVWGGLRGKTWVWSGSLWRLRKILRISKWEEPVQRPWGRQKSSMFREQQEHLRGWSWMNTGKSVHSVCFTSQVSVLEQISQPLYAAVPLGFTNSSLGVHRCESKFSFTLCCSFWS